MENFVIDQAAVREALQKHPGDAFEVLKKQFMELAFKTTLEQTNGNVMKAARELGITRGTIYVWLGKK